MDMQEILKQLRALAESDAECNKTEAGKYCPVHGMEECSMTEGEDADDVDDNWSGVADSGTDEELKRQDDEYYQAIKSGGEIPDVVVEPDRFVRYYEQKYGVKEAEVEEEENVEEDAVEETVDDDLDLKEDASVSISINGPEADAWIHRLSELAGQQMSPVPLAAKIGVPMEGGAPCEHCGQPMTQCICAHDDEGHCPECGAADGECDCDGAANTVSFGPDGIEMEEEHDFGHTDHPDAGEPVDVDTYMYKAPVGKQRIVKGMMGDNSLIKEDANRLFAKLKGDYRAYIAEAELAASNASGAQSPLTATDRDDFEKDPFAGEEPVNDGSRSPLSTIKRQDVAK